MGTDMSMFQISSTVILDSMKAFLECALHGRSVSSCSARCEIKLGIICYQGSGR